MAVLLAACCGVHKKTYMLYNNFVLRAGFHVFTIEVARTELALMSRLSVTWSTSGYAGVLLSSIW